MSNSHSDTNAEYVLLNPLPKHFEEIQELCRKVYPFSKPWSIEQLESHRSCFPDGQLIVVEKESRKVVGLAFSLIVDWNDYSPQDNWGDFTSGGYFQNHNPQKGKTLYGAEVMVDPEVRGKGIGKMLYYGRQKIVEKYNLKRIRAGARLRGYSKFQDKHNPQEYVRKVVAKEIYDPTLSFQLGQGFKVIDVAPNYLFNDPESLGFAAVIEWLNPLNISPAIINEQERAINQFLNEEKFIPTYLPKELRKLVRKATTSLGQVILENEGAAFYQRVEFYRQHLKKTRSKGKDQLKIIMRELAKENKATRTKLAHAFSLQLELINVCEAAYRTWRQRQRPLIQSVKSKINLNYVLTAHPTEARSSNTVSALSNLQGMLVKSFYDSFFPSKNALATQMRMLWLSPLSKGVKPSVLDEAEYIFARCFSSEIFDFILSEKPGYDLKLRTWVGGDKDGHPGVDKNVMKQCLNGSRTHILNTLILKFDIVLSDLVQLKDSKKIKDSEIQNLKKLSHQLKKLAIIVSGDGTKIKIWSQNFSIFIKKANNFIKQHEQIILIQRTLVLFPALVLPIEIREDSQVIKDALKKHHEAIFEMLAELNKIAGALDLTNYARGLIISHCETEEDIESACQLVQLACKNRNLPIVPLFETRSALVNGSKVLKKWLKLKKNEDKVKRHWGKKFEVMLGYSDSSKEIGVLPSRLLIAKAMNDIDRVLKSFQIVPIFFHGSGGSVARGGGNIKEQISWWSASAIANPKVTVQGEMIQRLFASKEILNSQCVHISNEALRRKMHKTHFGKNVEVDLLTKYIEDEYVKLVSNLPLLERMLDVTPYRYLDILKTGSRPSKRQSKNDFSLNSLRAIPWVLCWTQTRLLFPAWWGCGTAWTKMNAQEKENLKKIFNESPFLSSFVKTLSYTLAKVELDVWEMYFDGKEAQDKEFRIKVREEYKNAVSFVLEVSQQKQLIWHRQWLEESIKLRSSSIHILNLIQIIAARESDDELLRKTIVGIACGMLTTG